MERRPAWIFAALAVVIALVAGGWLVARELGRQSQEIADLRATLAAGSQPTPLPPTSAPAGTMVTIYELSPTPLAPTRVLPTPTLGIVPSAATPTPASRLPDPAAIPQESIASALAPAARGALAQRRDATLYRIGARLDPQRHTIDGAQTVRLTNGEGAPLSEIYFRLYVNAPHYNEGGIAVEDVRVDGQPAQTALEAGDTALKVALPQPLAPGQSAEIAMRFTTTVPSSGGGYGIFNAAGGVFALYNWHPELAVYENGAWLLNPVTAQGDPTNTDASNYLVAFAAPDGFLVASSGVQVAEQHAGGETVHQIAGALVRNMVLVASDRYKSATRQVGAATVTSYYLPADEAGGKAALDTAARALELFGKQFGAYPYTELDVTEVKLGGGAAGMESTGLVMIGGDLYGETDQLAALNGLVQGAQGLSVLSFTTAHETAHQWWYGVVGSDAYKQPWLDESLTNWSSEFYVSQVAGQDSGLLARDLFIGLPYRQLLAQGDERLDQPVDAFGQLEYSAIVYGKGALMYDVLRQQLGDQAFFAFLRRYYEQHQFARADGAAWRATLEAVAGKPAAGAFYQKWVEGAAITPADLPPGGPMDNLLGNLGGLDQLLATPTPAR